MLSDNFPGSDPGEVWIPSSGGGATVTETGNELVVTLPSGSASSSDANYITNRFYDFRGNAVSVKVTSAGNTATTATAYFAVGDGTGNFIEMQQRKGTLAFVKNLGSTWTVLKSTAYSPTNHLYWRFREDGVNTYWETSPDGATWQTQTQVATSSLFALSFVQVNMGAGTEGGEVNPGSVHYAKLNGGGTPAAKWCPVGSLTDDFSSTTRSAAWKRSWTNSPMTVAQTGGQLVFTNAVNDTKYSSYYSSASYDLTGSAIVLQVLQTANPATVAQSYLTLDGPAKTGVSFVEEKGTLYFRIIASGTYQNLGSILYDPVQQAWWRIRESGGTLFWDTAPDGKAWTVQAQLSPLPFAVNVLDIEIGSGTYQAQANPGASHYDNLNLPPP